MARRAKPEKGIPAQETMPQPVQGPQLPVPGNSFAVEALELVKTYPGKVTLFNFSLNIPEGGIFGLLGPNGAGKSTFIRILSGLEKEDSGAFRIFGQRPSAETRRKIGVAPQENCFHPLLTCMENLLYYGALYGITGKKAKERAQELINQLGLADKKNVQASFMSGGMKRRLNLACALMHEPRLIILDEPTTGLDPSTRRQLWETVTRIAATTNATVILTTHYMEEAEALCGKIAFVNKGQVAAYGTPRELKRLAGRELLKMKSVPGDYAKLEPLIKKLPGAETITVTEHGIVVEAEDAAALVSEVTQIFMDNSEKIIELSVSRPSLEDVFLKLTGDQLKEATKNEAAGGS
ncbi:MAG: ABC transporter ATP-binding protein [Candidatus Micrarchaeota archaeon]|nr:ABC transporter ATP-binding protein [Candidatus Micrarchaeota archaeon]